MSCGKGVYHSRRNLRRRRLPPADRMADLRRRADHLHGAVDLPHRGPVLVPCVQQRSSHCRLPRLPPKRWRAAAPGRRLPGHVVPGREVPAESATDRGPCDDLRPPLPRWRRSSRSLAMRGRRRRPTRPGPRRCAGRRGTAGAGCRPGVRLKRGAGAGCTIAVELDERAAVRRCAGAGGASAIDSTGAKHTSVPSISSHHSSRVLRLEQLGEALLAAPASRVRSCWRAKPSSPAEAGALEQLGVELRLDRADRRRTCRRCVS